MFLRPFDFHPCRSRIGENIQLFHPDSCAFDSPVLQAGFGNSFGQSFDQANMTGTYDGANLVGDLLIVHHTGEFLANAQNLLGRLGGLLPHREIDIDPHTLRAGVLVGIDTDPGGQDHVAQEDMP